MKKAIFYPILLVALVVAGWFGWQWSRSGPVATVSGKADSAPVADKPGKGRGGPVIVNAMPAVSQRIEDKIAAVGTLLAAQTVEVAPEIDGRVVEIGVADGEQVSREAVLFRLDGSVTNAELAQARAELGLARADLARARNLAKNSFVSERSREEAQANVKVLEAKLQVVSARLAKTEIRAPFDGRVGLVRVSVGEYVKAGTSLVRLDDLSSLKLDLRIPERLFSRVRIGQAIRVGFDAWPEREFLARIETIDSEIENAGRSLVIRGRLDNEENLLRPGMFARARLVLEARESAVMVPEEAVLASAEGEYVYVVRDDEATRQPVRTGTRSEGLVEVLDGVAAGDMIVTAGQGKLRGAKAPVKIIAPATESDRRQDAGSAAALATG